MHLSSLKPRFLLILLCQPLYCDPSPAHHPKEVKVKKPEKNQRAPYRLPKWLQKPKELTEHVSFFELLLYLAYEFKIEFAWVIADACIKSMGMGIATYMQYSIITQLKPQQPKTGEPTGGTILAVLDSIKKNLNAKEKENGRNFDLGTKGWFSEMFCQILKSAHETLCDIKGGREFGINGSDEYEWSMYLATFVVSCMFVLMGTYSQEIINKLFEICIDDSFTRPFTTETANYLSQNGFEELMNKTHRFHMTYHQALKVEALEGISPLFAKMLIESVMPTIVQIVSLLMRQVFIAVYERSIGPIVSFLFTLMFITINILGIYSEVSRASLELNEALKSLNSGSADTVSNALLVAQSGQQTSEIQSRRLMIDQVVIATYRLNKVKNNVAFWLTKYGVMYGMIHALFGDLSIILEPALSRMGFQWFPSLLVEKTPEISDQKMLIMLFFSLLTIYTDTRNIRNAIAKVIESQIQLKIDEASLGQYRRIIFSSDKLPYDPSALEFQLNPYSENTKRLKIEMDEAFSYKNKEAADQELKEKQIREIQTEIGKAIIEDS